MVISPDLRAGLLAGGAPRMWEGVVRDTLPHARKVVPPGSQVLEVGYGNGLLSCFLAAELDCDIVGLDVLPAARDSAQAAARRFGLEDRLDFRLCSPDATRKHSGQWDAVFVKTVFYSSHSLTDYAEWLDWVKRILRPGGALISYETGRASALMQLYRRLRKREYTDRCLYTSAVERLYDERFNITWRRHYGGFSQFAAPIPWVFEATRSLENALARRTADNCFIVATVAQRLGE